MSDGTRPMKGSSWTPERVEILKAAVAAGDTYEMISLKLGGISRSGCVAKASRMGLAVGATVAESRHRARMQRRRDQESRRKSREAARIIVRKTRKMGQKTLSQTQKDARYLEPLGTNEWPERKGCYWITGHPIDREYQYCARPLKLGAVYCEHHHALSIRESTYVPRAKR